MSRYEQRLEDDKASIREQLRTLGSDVCSAIERAARAAATNDAELATDVILGDLPINRRFLRLDYQCHLFIARHLPSAQHLRFVSGVLRVNVILERVGDYAETIARAALQVRESPPPVAATHITEIATRAHTVLREAVETFLDEDVDQAKRVRKRSKRRGSTFGKTFEDLSRAASSSESTLELFALLAIFSRLERVISQARSICRQTVFVVTGEVRKGKVFPILVVDEHGSLAPLATAYIRRAYPDNETCQAAAWDPQPLPAAISEFGESKSLDLDENVLSMADATARLTEFDIVIDLSGRVREDLEQIPFQTTILPWALEAHDDPQRAYEQLTEKVSELFGRLVGKQDG